MGLRKGPRLSSVQMPYVCSSVAYIMAAQTLQNRTPHMSSRSEEELVKAVVDKIKDGYIFVTVLMAGSPDERVLLAKNMNIVIEDAPQEVTKEVA